MEAAISEFHGPGKWEDRIGRALAVGAAVALMVAIGSTVTIRAQKASSDSPARKNNPPEVAKRWIEAALNDRANVSSGVGGMSKLANGNSYSFRLT